MGRAYVITRKEEDVIYYVTVTPKLITECSYRIAAPDARTAEKAGINLFLEALKHSSLTLSVASEEDINQDDEPDFFAHKEDQE